MGPWRDQVLVDCAEPAPPRRSEGSPRCKRRTPRRCVSPLSRSGPTSAPGRHALRRLTQMLRFVPKGCSLTPRGQLAGWRGLFGEIRAREASRLPAAQVVEFAYTVREGKKVRISQKDWSPRSTARWWIAPRATQADFLDERETWHRCFRCNLRQERPILHGLNRTGLLVGVRDLLKF